MCLIRNSLELEQYNQKMGIDNPAQRLKMSNTKLLT